VTYPADAAYLDLGNAPAFTINTTLEKLEHFSSRSGLSKKDLEVITKMTMAGSFTLDEPNAENLAMFLMSAAGAEANAQGVITTETADAITNLYLNRWYPITKTGAGTASVPALATPAPENPDSITLAVSGSPAATADHSVKVLVVTSTATGTIKVSVDGSDWSTGVSLTGSAYTFSLSGDATEDLLNGITLTFSGAGTTIGDIFSFDINYATPTPVQYSNITAVTGIAGAEGTDYIFDKAAGLVMFIGTSWTEGVSDVTPVVTATANADRTMTKGGTLTSLKGDLYFVGDPPQGRVLDIMGYCSLTPNGDWALIGEDWMQVQFNIEFLEVAGQAELIKVIDRGKSGTL
jgi:hypothetical protein